MWMHQLRVAKERIIKENLGHAEVSPSDKVTNLAASHLAAKKGREKEMTKQHTFDMQALPM
jgi:hypothetical protein